MQLQALNAYNRKAREAVEIHRSSSHRGFLVGWYSRWWLNGGYMVGIILGIWLTQWLVLADKPLNLDIWD